MPIDVFVPSPRDVGGVRIPHATAEHATVGDRAELLLLGSDGKPVAGYAPDRWASWEKTSTVTPTAPDPVDEQRAALELAVAEAEEALGRVQGERSSLTTPQYTRAHTRAAGRLTTARAELDAYIAGQAPRD